jgi:hypothetical protein
LPVSVDQPVVVMVTSMRGHVGMHARVCRQLTTPAATANSQTTNNTPAVRRRLLLKWKLNIG